MPDELRAGGYMESRRAKDEQQKKENGM